MKNKTGRTCGLLFSKSRTAASHAQKNYERTSLIAVLANLTNQWGVYVLKPALTGSTTDPLPLSTSHAQPIAPSARRDAATAAHLIRSWTLYIHEVPGIQSAPIARDDRSMLPGQPQTLMITTTTDNRLDDAWSKDGPGQSAAGLLLYTDPSLVLQRPAVGVQHFIA